MFIRVEQRLLEMDQLGVKKQFNKIIESEISSYPMVKLAINQISKQLYLPEYRIAEDFISIFSPYKWDETISTSINIVSENLKKNKENIQLQNAIDSITESDSAYLLSGFQKELDNYYIKRSDSTRVTLVEKLGKYNFNILIQKLIETINMASKTFKISNLSGHINISEIYSPTIILEGHTIFSTGSHFIKKSSDGALIELNKSEIKSLPLWFTNMVNYINSDNVIMENNYIKTYIGDKKVELYEEDGNVKIKLNDKHIALNEFNKVFMVTGIFHKSEVGVMNEINNVIEHFEKITHIKFAKRIEDIRSSSKYADVFSTNEGIYISQINKKVNLRTFGGMTPIYARNQIFEFLNYDLGETFKEVLDMDEAEIKKITESRERLIDEINILKNKKVEIKSTQITNIINEDKQLLEELVLVIDNEIESLHSQISKHNSSIQAIREGNDVSTNIPNEDEYDDDDMLIDNSESIDDIFEIEDIKAKVGDTVILESNKTVFIQSYDETIDQYIGIDLSETVYAHNLTIFGYDDIMKISESNDYMHLKFKIQDKIIINGSKTGVIVAINIPSRIYFILMEDGVSIKLSFDSDNKIQLVDNNIINVNDDDVKQETDKEKTAIVESIISTEYVKGESLKTGETIEVNAMEYTRAGNNDDITIILDNKKQKLKKKYIQVLNI